MCWAMSVMVAICVTPGFDGFRRPGAAPHPAMLAQDNGPVAVPGSADAPASNGSDDDDDQSGQAANDGQTPDDDAAQQPPANMQQPPTDDDGDTSAQQQSDDNGDQGTTPAPSGDDQN
jgi:hypothetical protein